MPISKSIANVILHVVLLGSFIALFFFLYASIIEQKIVISQVDNVSTDLTSDLKTVLSEEERQVIEKAFKSLTAPDMTKEDSDAKKANKKLMIQAGKIVGITFTAGIITVALLSWLGGFSFIAMLLDNLTLLMVAAATEFVFISFFVRNFLSLDPNTVKLSIVNSLTDYANK